MTEHVTSDDEVPGYELRIAGHLDDHWSAWFDGLALSHEDDGTTLLRGTEIDQAELHGLLAKARDLGATLISVNPVGRISDRPLGSPGADAATPGRGRRCWTTYRA